VGRLHRARAADLSDFRTAAPSGSRPGLRPDQAGRRARERAAGPAAATLGGCHRQRRRARRRRPRPRRCRHRRATGGRRHAGPHDVNEVVANLANERLGGRRGRYVPIHPNSHVNLGQSSNDVTPTAIRLMALELLEPLDAELTALVRALRRHAARERNVVKPGRTHLQDAVPITWGQVLGGWAQALDDGRRALRAAADELSVVALGGTAVGTGLTAHPRFRPLVVRELSRLAGRRLRPAPSPVRRRGHCARCSPPRPPCGASPWISRRSASTCACWPPVPTPASPSCGCPRSSRARRSCRAR